MLHRPGAFKVNQYGCERTRCMVQSPISARLLNNGKLQIPRMQSYLGIPTGRSRFLIARGSKPFCKAGNLANAPLLQMCGNGTAKPAGILTMYILPQVNPNSNCHRVEWCSRRMGLPMLPSAPAKIHGIMRCPLNMIQGLPGTGKT